MAQQFADRVKETTATTGTGSFTLAGAVAGFQAFDDAITTGNTVSYMITRSGGTEWEVGLGTFTSPATLSRDTIYANSNGDTDPVSFTAGTKTVFQVISAADIAAAGADGLADPGSNGLVVRTALDTTVNRTIAGTANQITVSNGDGVSGNPTISLTGMTFPIQTTMAAGDDVVITMLQDAMWGFTINSATFQTDSGTISAVIAIDGTPVTGLDGPMALTSSEDSDTASAANVVSAGGKVTCTFSSNSSAVNASVMLKCTRT